MRCGAGINAALARSRRRRSGLAHRCGERQCRERAGIRVGARGALASLRGRSGASGQRAHRPIGGVGVHVHLDAGSWPSWSLSMRGARRDVGAPRAPRDGEEVGNHHSNCAYTSDPPAPRLGSEQGAGSADPTHRARETGRHNARLRAGVIPSGTIKQSRLHLLGSGQRTGALSRS